MNTPTTISRATQQIIAARTSLIFQEPFWGQLALKLVLQEDSACKTAWTDGRALGYNPAFIATLSQPQIKALVAHEVMHCANGHPWRRDAREPREWNKAADRAINPVLRDAGFILPDGALYELEPNHKGMSAEWIFDRLPKPQPQQPRPQDSQPGEQDEDEQGGEGAGAGEQQDEQDENEQGGAEQDEQGGGEQQQDDDGEEEEGDRGEPEQDAAPDPLGEVRDAPVEVPEGEAPPTEIDWQQAVQQAAALAEGQGKLPGALQRIAETAGQSRIDWRSALRRFVQEVTKADYTWLRPSARYMASGLYLPALRTEETGVLAIGVDTSGSIDTVLLNQFAVEVQAMVDEVHPRQVHVFYCDSQIAHVDVFERDEPVEFHAAGGGGTDFRPVFAAVEAMEEQPVALVYLTDLYGVFPEQDAGVPTLWVTGRESRVTVPFGEVVTAA